MIVHVVEDSELVTAIVQEGNFDDVVHVDNEKVYVKYGVDRVWIARPSGNKTYVLYTSCVEIARRSIVSIIRKIIDRESSGISIGKISVPLF